MSLETDRGSRLDAGDGEPPAEDGLLIPRAADATPTVSIVLPTLDEEAGIVDCIERAKNALVELGMTGEIIVSDSSEDRTPELAREHDARVLTGDPDFLVPALADEVIDLTAAAG